MSQMFEVDQVVPHSGTMSLLSTIVDYDDESLHARVTIGPDSLFCQADGVPAWVGIEYMAQAIGAFAGVQKHLKGQLPAIGFLVGSRRYRCNQPYFPVGAVLEVTASRSYQAENGLGVFDCEIRSHDLLATAALNVFQPDNVDAFLQEKNSE